MRVRMGSTTGPVKIAILRGQVDPNTANVSCCTELHESAVFTPQANGITTEPVNLPVLVQNSPDPNNGLEEFDLVGLTLLENGVQIPLINQTSEATNDQPSDFYHAPAWQLNTTEGASDLRGYLLDLQATWTNGGGGGPGGNPTLNFAGGNPLKIKGKNALVHVSCVTLTCDGTVALQSVPAVQATAASAKHKRKHKTVTYASGSFNIPAGQSKSIAAALSAQGRKAAKHHKRIKVYINIHLKTSSGTKVITRSVTIRF